jgi:hypothetical protein
MLFVMLDLDGAGEERGPRSERRLGVDDWVSVLIGTWSRGAGDAKTRSASPREHLACADTWVSFPSLRFACSAGNDKLRYPTLNAFCTVFGARSIKPNLSSRPSAAARFIVMWHSAWGSARAGTHMEIGATSQ